jgi:anti-sigma28 factor (negative regulator of flagellin synthesis)
MQGCHLECSKKAVQMREEEKKLRRRQAERLRKAIAKGQV